MFLLGHLLALIVRLWAKSCRVRVRNDPRPALRAAQKPYVYALLHAHQIAAVLANDEPRMAAMVSRSADGDLLVPSLAARGVLAVRGSGRRGTVSKGGEAALKKLITLNRAGMPVLLAVDGPRGPRGRVHRGIVALAQATGAVILPVSVMARKDWVLHKTWDLTRIPSVGTTIQLSFGVPVEVEPKASPEALQEAIGAALAECEHQGCHD
jgi:lysophospholipid acyltransferase (LPLAT)-like uncharacterized protein